MTKAKKIILLLAFIIIMLLFPSIVNAATIEAIETTMTSTGKNVKWSYELDSNNKIINLKCSNISEVTGELTIPSTIDGYTVLTIGNRSFYNCYGLKNITIPDSVAIIGSSAFWGCSGLTSVTLPNTGNLTTIKEGAFYGCTGMRNITIPNSVTTIEEYAFKNCSGLKELILSQSLTKISEGTFYNCSGLESVILPDNVTTICGSLYDGAFGGCKKLEKILIPDSVATIEKYAFQNCSNLTIYGNEGMTSKEYAEENEINFKYISEWDKSDVGDDITPPAVESIVVPYSNVFEYYDSNSTTYIIPTGKVLIINVKFSEPITATEIPTLTIKFGSGENIQLKNGTINGSTIAYTYTIANGNIGTMSIVSLSEGNAKDAAGNQATLSCTKLTVSLDNHYIYANGTASIVDNTQSQDPINNNTNKNETTKEDTDNTQTGNNETNDNNTENNNKSDNKDINNSETTKNDENTSDKNDTTNKEQSTANKDTLKKEDTTVATSKLPNTGIGIGLIVAIVSITIVGILEYFKYNKLKGI